MTDSIDTSEREAEEPAFISLPVREMSDEPAPQQPANTLRTALQLALEATPEQLPAALDALRDQLGLTTSSPPCAMRYDFDGHGWQYIDAGSGSDWMTRIPGAEPVYDWPTTHGAPDDDGDLLTIAYMHGFAKGKDAASAPPAPQAITPELDVRKIMLSIEPGADGMAVEVYAKSIADVEAVLGKMGEELEDWRLGIKRFPAPQAAVVQQAQPGAIKKALYALSMLFDVDKAEQWQLELFDRTVAVLKAASDHLPDAGKKIAVDIEAAAKVLAERMDYPWQPMPEQGRQAMRGHAKAVIGAAFGITGD